MTLPPALDTKVLRQATDDEGVLEVLGAAEIVRSLSEDGGGARGRLREVAEALEEWCEKGEGRMSFRISSWRKQRNRSNSTTEDSNRLTAFVGSEAVSKRLKFASALRSLTSPTHSLEEVLIGLEEEVQKMNKPCLRLEVLQYALGLEGRFTLGMMRKSIGLARGIVVAARNTTVDLGGGGKEDGF